MAVCPFGTARSRRYIPWLSIAVPGAGWLLFGLYPSLATIAYSFTQYSGVPGTALNVCGLCNYKSAFTSLLPQVGQSIWVTILYAGAVTILQNVLGLALALLLNKRGRSFTVYRALIFMPQVFSVAVVGAMFSLLLDPYSGPVEKFVHSLFGGSYSLLGSSSTALPLVIGINIWMFTGYTMLIYIAGLRNIPGDVYEAAALDGAGRLKAFLHMTWPLLASAATVNVFLTAMGSLGEYSLILVLTNGNFGTQTLGMYMFSSAFGQNSQLGYGSMLAMLQFIITLIVGGALLYSMRRREVSL